MDSHACAMCGYETEQYCLLSSLEDVALCNDCCMLYFQKLMFNFKPSDWLALYEWVEKNAKK